MFLKKKMSIRYEKQEKWICHWMEVNSGSKSFAH